MSSESWEASFGSGFTVRALQDIKLVCAFYCQLINIYKLKPFS